MPGFTEFIGGGGNDGVNYSYESGAVTVNLATGIGSRVAARDTFKGIETVVGSKFADVLLGNGAANHLSGGGGMDVVNGAGGNDFIDGGAGADIIGGGDGDDILLPGNDLAGDAFAGGAGNDWIYYTQAASNVTAYLNLNLSAQRAQGDSYNGVENVLGSEYSDILAPGDGGRAHGGGGNDIIYDAGATEILRGGMGQDFLSDVTAGGEDGLRDIFFLEAGYGRDTIQGFTQGQDLLWLDAVMFGELAVNSLGQLADGRVVNDSDNNFNANATEAFAQLIYDTFSQVLWYDSNGTGVGGVIDVAHLATFSGKLAKTDFLVVPDV